MHLNLSHIGQIAMAVADVGHAEAFYAEKLGLRKLYRFGDLVFSIAPVCGCCWKKQTARKT